MTEILSKIISLDGLSSGQFSLNADQKVVICHGHFNIIHPGHLRFLQHAKSLGDILILGVHHNNYFVERERSKYYTQELRTETVATIQAVDYVIPFDNENDFEKVVQLINPDVYIMGKEFEHTRRNEVAELINLCELNNCKIVFHAGEIQYSNSDLLNENHSKLKDRRIHSFQNICRKLNLNQEELVNCIDQYKSAKILIIGDTIIDQYVACDALGMSSEAPVLVVKEMNSKQFIGGAAIIAAHINGLGADCHYLSVIGRDDNGKYLIDEFDKTGIASTLLIDESRTTTFKIRYLVDNQKLFRVSRMSEHSINSKLEVEIIEKIEKLAPQYDCILVSDFVYGVITPNILSCLQRLAKENDILLLGDLQCSSQVGKVTKFENFNLICPTEKEARIALNNQGDSLEWVANTILEQTNTSNLLLKLGSNGFISYATSKETGFIKRQHFPALETNPRDVTGAGDALISCMAVNLSIGADLMAASAISAIMASIAVQNIGNIPIRKSELKNKIEFFLNDNI